MPLSRLENFLKNVEGNILYVNPTDLDATDSIENQGNSLTKLSKLFRERYWNRLDFHIRSVKIMTSSTELRFCCTQEHTKSIIDQDIT